MCLPAVRHVDRPPVEHAHENRQPFFELLGQKNLQNDRQAEVNRTKVGATDKEYYVGAQLLLLLPWFGPHH